MVLVNISYIYRLWLKAFLKNEWGSRKSIKSLTLEYLELSLPFWMWTRLVSQLLISHSQTSFQTPYTVELQWLKHPWTHENMIETGEVRANGC